MKDNGAASARAIKGAVTIRRKAIRPSSADVVATRRAPPGNANRVNACEASDRVYLIRAGPLRPDEYRQPAVRLHDETPITNFSNWRPANQSCVSR